MGGGGTAAYAPERCSAVHSEQSATLQMAVSRTPGALDRGSSATGTGSCSTAMSRSGSEMMNTSAAEAAQVRQQSAPQNSSSPRGTCDPGSLPAAVASADAHAVTSGNAADMAALLTAHRQIAMGRTASAETLEVQGNLRACSGVLESAAKTACAAFAKAGPAGGLPWQVAVLDAMPLGPTALDYSFTARGELPKGVQQSKLAEAFGPEGEESQGNEGTPGKAERMQIGDALVALLESHRKHRYKVASADPEQISRTLGSLPDDADGRVEVDKRARSLTRCLTRSAASSPLVQLLATHRRRREDLTGWRDEASYSSDDEIPHVQLSSALAAQSPAGGRVMAENALTLKPLLTPAEQAPLGALPPLLPTMAKTGEPERPHECPGSPTEPPLPPSSRSSADGRSSVSSYRSAVAGSVFSRASSDAQSVEWVSAESSIPPSTPWAGRSSLDNLSSRRRSTEGRASLDGWSSNEERPALLGQQHEGRASFEGRLSQPAQQAEGQAPCQGRPSLEGRPPLPGQLLRQANTAESTVSVVNIASTPAQEEPAQAGIADGQCPGCGSMSSCCCKEMELGSHPDLESVSEDAVLTPGAVTLGASKEAASPAASLDRGRSSVESHKNLRRMLLKTMSNDEERPGKEASAPQKIGTSPHASFSEVLETCMRSNSCSTSGARMLPSAARMLPVSDLQAPFIPMATSSRSSSGGDDDRRAEQQPLGSSRAWSFDGTLYRQHLTPHSGVLNRHSMDDGDKSRKGQSLSSYAALMAEYRNRMGMDRQSRSSSLSNLAENPSASMHVCGALRQAFRSQLQSPTCSPPSFESPLLGVQYHALRSGHSTPAGGLRNDRAAEVRAAAQPSKAQPAAAAAARGLSTVWPISEAEPAASGTAGAQVGTQQERLAQLLQEVSAPEGQALAPHAAASAALASLMSKALKERAAVLSTKASSLPVGSGRPPASPRPSMESPSKLSASKAEAALPALPEPRSFTAAVATFSVAHTSSPQGTQGPQYARQSCARARASLELRRSSADAAMPVRPRSEHPAISFPLLPNPPVPAQLPTAFIKGSQSQRSSMEEAQMSQSTDTCSVLAAVAAQLGQRDSATPWPAPCHEKDTTDAVIRQPSVSRRRSAQLTRQLPTVEEGVAVPAGLRELSLNLGVPDVQEQLSSSTTPPPDASHEPPDVSPPDPAPEMPASGSAAAGRLAAAQQLFFQGAQPARRRMPTAASMLAADNALGPAQQAAAARGLRPVQLLPLRDSAGHETTAKRAPRPSSPGTPPAVSEASPFAPLSLERPAAPPPSTFLMQGLSEGMLHSSGHGLGQHGQPVSAGMAIPASSPMASAFGSHHGPFGYSSPPRSTTGSHELEDTYGAHRLRSDQPWALGSSGAAASQWHTAGSVAPSSFWVEHRAAAHHTAVGSLRGHVSMDETRLQTSTWMMPPLAFNSGSTTQEVLLEDAECLFSARRDNYVARTFSHMARARLDHAVARSAEAEALEGEKWEMRFCDDGPCTLSQSGSSEEGDISKAKRMMAEAATAQASTFMRGEGTDQRDVDGTCCLLDALTAPKASSRRQQDVLSSLAFLTAGSEANSGSVVASGGMAALVPLLGKRCERTVVGAVKVISNILLSPAGQDAFVEENGLTVLSSLLATSKAPSVLQSVLRCLGTFTEGCMTSLAQRGISGQALGDLGSLSALAEAGGQLGQAAGNALLLERSRAIAAAIRLASEHASSAEGCADGVSAAALELLLKISAMPGLRNSLRTAGLMSALAIIVTPDGVDTGKLLEPAIQLVAALSSDVAAAVEFTAGGGVLGLLAILSDTTHRSSLLMHAATVMGVLVNCRRVRGAVWAAGGASALLPTLATASPQALRGLLYLLSCLAKFGDMRAEMEAAGAVDVLLELLSTCPDTKVQAATLSLLRILTRAGKTLCATQEPGSSVPDSGSIVPGRASLGSRGASGSEKRRSLDGPPAPREALSACQALAASGRSQSLCLF